MHVPVFTSEPGRKHYFSVTAAGLVLCTLGVFGSSFSTTYSSFVFWYACVFGLGAGVIFTAPLTVAWANYPNSQGRVTGVVISAHGLAPVFFNPITTAVANPHNLSPTLREVSGSVTRFYFDADVAERVPSMLLCLSVIFLVLTVVILLTSGNITPAEQYNEEEMTVGEGLKTAVFWKLFTCCLLTMMYCMYLAPAYKDFGMLRIHDDHFFTVVGSLAALFNGGSRFIWAEVVESIGFRKTYLFVAAIAALTSTTIYYFATTKLTFLLYVLLGFAATGGHFVVFPTACAKLFGKGTGASLYAILFASVGVASFLGFAVQFLWISDIGYQFIFMILAVASCGSFCLALTVEENLPNLKLAEKLI